MENIKNKGYFKIVRFDKDDYINNFDEINTQMLRIVSSHEKSGFDYEEAKQNLADLNNDLFLSLLWDTKLYVVIDTREDNPVSFALFSHDQQRADWHLEYICTHEEYTNAGIAEGLLKMATIDLSKTEYKQITSTVNKSNHASLAMHDRFANSTNIDLSREWVDEDRVLYVFDTSKLDENQLKDEAEDLIY